MPFSGDNEKVFTVLCTFIGVPTQLTVFSMQRFTPLLVSHLPLIVGTLPLLSAVVAGLVHKKRLWSWLSTWLMASAMCLGGYLLVLADHGTTWQNALTWVHIPGSNLFCCLKLSFFIDFPVAVMVSLTTMVSFIIHLYALAYMQTARRRYFVLTGSFVSAMLGFLMADNLIARFIGWEVIGLGSYLLISFWYQQETAASNGTKTWLMNQIGSMSLLIGVLVISSELGSFDLTELAQLSKDTSRSNGWLTMASFCLLGGICAKSAQLPWYSWLPNAMTAPTPSSALIHTATMVGAGVYLLVGLSPILDTATLTVAAYLGSLTTLIGAYVACKQQHIKQVLAYSTISQIGYVMMAIGVGANNVGLFHFVTHAFCKSCLFLCVGSVSRFLRQQGAISTMQHMGGLLKKLPGTFCAYIVASCSLVGIPGFAGALSKEAVVARTLAWANQQAEAGNYIGYIVPVLGFVSSVLAVVYLGRQCCLVFMGTPRWPKRLVPAVPYHTPRLMQVSITSLALCSLGCLYSPLVLDFHSSWLLQRLAHTPRWVSTFPLSSTPQQEITFSACITLVLGFLLLAIWHLKSSATLLLPRTKWLHLNIHTNTIARAVLNLSRLIAKFDDRIVNSVVGGIGVSYVALGNLISWLDRKLLSGVVLLIALSPRYFGKAHKKTQQGNLQHSLLWMLMSIGLVFLGVYWATRGLR